MSIKNTLYTGCSFTYGTGFDEEFNSDLLWVNIFHKSNPVISKTKLINQSSQGISNDEIFIRTVKNLTEQHFDYAFVQWTSIPRMEIHTGLETYSTQQGLSPNSYPITHGLNDITFEADHIEKVKNQLFMMMHDHFQLVKLVEYVNILIKLSKLTNTKIYFINGICPWDKDFFAIKDNFKPNELTNYTQQLIKIENRDDVEIDAIYKKMHNEYKEKGGIQEDYWINLYSSYSNLKIDVNNDNKHPGVQSNINYAELLNEKINNIS